MSDRREPLDAGERALAAALPRLHGREAPDAGLDAKILAAAHAAAARAAPGPARRRSWIVPISAAASLALAVGLAWRLRPLPPPITPAHAPVEATRLPVAGAPLPTAAPPPPPAAAPAAPPSGASPPRQASSRPADVAAAEPDAQVAPAAPPPPAPPAPPAPPPPSTVAAQEAAPRASAPQAAATKARGEERDALDTITVSGTRVRSDGEQAAEAHAEAAADDVPPATADSPEVREAWLGRIGDLLREGREVEARESLAEFRRRYPDSPLPPELRGLLP